jgi:hypothetical protein
MRGRVDVRVAVRVKVSIAAKEGQRKERGKRW